MLPLYLIAITKEAHTVKDKGVSEGIWRKRSLRGVSIKITSRFPQETSWELFSSPSLLKSGTHKLNHKPLK